MVAKVAVFIMILVVVMLLWARSLKEDQAAATAPPSDSVVAPISEGLKDGVIKSGERAEQKLKDSAVEHGTTLKDRALEEGENLAEKAQAAAQAAGEAVKDQAYEASDNWRWMLKKAAEALPEKQ
jgi:hypothetical protein